MTTSNDGVTFNAAIAWGILMLTLVAATDITPLATVGALFAWLFFVSVLYKFGPDAFRTITSINTGDAATNPPIERRGGK